MMGVQLIMELYAEINDMLKGKLGKTSTRWIYNYAFAIVDSRGHDRPVRREYVWLLIRSLFFAYLRRRHYLPASALQVAGKWVFESFYMGRELGIPNFLHN